MRLQWACRGSALTLGLTLLSPLPAPASEKIVLGGSTGVMPLVAALAKVYQERYPAAAVEMGTGRSSGDPTSSLLPALGPTRKSTLRSSGERSRA
jgi:ABC-type phosphate transport system substrate-binding protein